MFMSLRNSVAAAIMRPRDSRFFAPATGACVVEQVVVRA